jgi:PAS domain S-box-containing protein
MDTAQPQNITQRAVVDRRTALAALALSVAYYLGTKIGFALTFHPYPISTLWPPNSILLAALLLAPTRSWWLFLLAALPAHLAGELQSGVPTTMVLAWFVSNCSEALIGAIAIRAFSNGPLRLDSVRDVTVFVVFGVFVAPLLSSFLDAGFVRLIGWGEGSYWELFRARVFSNALAALTLVPVIVTWVTTARAVIRRASLRDYVEAAFIALGLIGVTFIVFDGQSPGSGSSPALLYAPVPFLLWAAVRFGPLGTSTALLPIAFFAIWGAIHGAGPLVADSPMQSALSVQLFLTAVAVPLLFLAAVIKERERTQEALHSSEQLFAKAFGSSPIAMVITGRPDNCIIEVNERWQALFGYARHEAVGRTLSDLGVFSAEDETKVTRGLRDVELRLRDRSREVKQAIVAAEQVEMAGRPCIITAIHDVTEQRHIEREAAEQRRRMNLLTRVALLGELTGALAHELNQPLMAILANAQAMQRFLTHDPVDLDEIREIAGDIIEEDKRAGDVIHRLRALLRKGEAQFQLVDVNDLVREALTLSQADLAARNVRVNARYGENLNEVRGDRIQLQQVLLNLIVNACEAMMVNKPELRYFKVETKPGNSGGVHITVADTGPGIAPEGFDKLFEPFFTTKDHGLGLGLSISRAITAAHGGRLWAENAPTRGAIFCISLPSPTRDLGVISSDSVATAPTGLP